MRIICWLRWEFPCWLLGCNTETEQPWNTPEDCYLEWCKRCGREYGFGHYDVFCEGIIEIIKRWVRRIRNGKSIKEN